MKIIRTQPTRFVVTGALAIASGLGLTACTSDPGAIVQATPPAVTAAPSSASEPTVTAEPSPLPGGETETTAAQTVKWQSTDDVAAATFADGVIFYPETDEAIEVGSTPDGGDRIAFLRLPLGTEFFASEVQSAKLFLKPVSASVPAAIDVGAVGASWTVAFTDHSDQPGLLPDSATVTEVPVTTESDGWISLDVTPQVKAWLSGDQRNNGFVLSGVPGQPLADFTFAEPSIPYLQVSGTAGARDLDYGRFGFSEQPLGDVFTIEDSGNCLSNALRDNDSILFDDLNLNYYDINRIFTESGADGVAEYVAQHIEDYVAAHQESLHISDFRRLTDFDSPIDPKTEYRIALRIGASQPNGLPMEENGGFDYHLWSQIDDGRWSQKFPQEYSMIIPGTNAETSPDKYLWDSGRQFGQPKTQDFYQSKVIYFAVTKNTPDFTTHKS